MQNDWQAVNKKKTNLICTIHVTLYILPFLLTSLTPFQIFLIYTQHWIQDRTDFISWWCRNIGSFQRELKHNALVANNQYEKVLPWGHFVVDQVFHFIWMWIVVEFIKY